MGVSQREDRIDLISNVDVLRERLKAAERLAVIFGWCAARDKEGPRDRLAYEAWREWHELVQKTDAGDMTGIKANRQIDQDVRVREGRN